MFSSFNFKYIAARTPVAANVVPNIPGKIVSYPKFPILTIAIGTSAQCKPKITKHCHNAPMTKAVTIGEKAYNPANIFDKTVVNKLTTGPITSKPIGSEIIKTKNGTKKFCNISGTNFFAIF